MVPIRPLHDAPPPYDTVVFDCDSTLSAMEGIEELVGDDPAIACLTAAAMDGQVPLEEVYGRRLELSRPHLDDMARIGALYIEHALPHTRELLGALKSLGKQVRIVSGGLLEPVRQFGLWLGLEASDIEAVDLYFDGQGNYTGYDQASPLARSGGKIEVLGRIKAAPGCGAVAFVGDGATDLEAAHLAQRFIAYGGVEQRKIVAEAALVTCDEPDFAALCPLLFSPSELKRLAQDADHAAWLPPEND